MALVVYVLKIILKFIIFVKNNIKMVFVNNVLKNYQIWNVLYVENI